MYTTKIYNSFVLILLIILNACSSNIKEEPKSEKEEYVDLVYPFLDAANSRWFYFSSASRPFGMVNLSPDMSIKGAWNSGYRYKEDSIKFFSHIHAWQLSGVPVMPTVGEFKGHLGPDQYQSKYSHEKEKVFPGFHEVMLEDYQIKAELTSTTRVGFHRYTFPKSAESNILLDLGTVLGPSGTRKGNVKKVSDQEIEGYALMEKTGRRPKDTYVYFVIQLEKPFQTLNAWKDKKLIGEVNEFDGENGGVYFGFETEENEQVQMKVGISYVSAAQARLNIETELPHWDFEQVVQESRAEWNEKLGRIKVSGNDEQQTRRFYTDLWKALQGRRIISDANGKYCDMTGEKPRIGQIPLENGKPKFNHFNSDSFWGAQWTITSLWQLVYPEIAEDFVNSMLLMYDDGGLIPRGPSGGNYTYVMTGASSTPFIVGAYMKGIRGFDVEKAYEGMKKNALPGGMMSKAGYEHETTKGGGIEYYIEKGYVPYPLGKKRWGGHQQGAGQTLEYSYQDWCLAQLAKSLGKTEDYELFMKRSENWKNLYDEESGWIRAKGHDGKWWTPYDPFELNHGFVESNGAQSTWYVPHDLPGLGEKMGGNEKMAEKLNESFEKASELGFTSGNAHADETDEKFRRIPINYGNQPSIQTAFVFNHIGHPWLTQYWSREVLDKAFSQLSPERGFNGDEDQGLMGSLSVLMKIGLFEMKSGNEAEPKMELGSPIFEEINIKLSPDYFQGKEFTIKAKGNSEQNRYIQSVKLNGKTHESIFLNFHDLTKGATVKLEMGDQPKK
ncbi:GH92 family glycosyl hydrolase [Flexithrix dorotheae]|uniref:GH92 family glycosyl hydrolase n=1 Tax=Flexithrix dorotheae TaxID=70993 RepID=UPI00036C7F72|nr:GH92 family glycosyl hydrolase [Flexithrix dorotheae]